MTLEIQLSRKTYKSEKLPSRVGTCERAPANLSGKQSRSCIVLSSTGKSSASNQIQRAYGSKRLDSAQMCGRVSKNALLECDTNYYAIVRHRLRKTQFSFERAHISCGIRTQQVSITWVDWVYLCPSLWQHSSRQMQRSLAFRRILNRSLEWMDKRASSN